MAGPPKTARAGSAARIPLLDGDSELADSFDADERRELAAVTVPALRLPRGSLDGLRAQVHPNRRVGLLIMRGAVLHQMTLLGRVSGRLLGPGEVIRPWAPPTETFASAADEQWSVVVEGVVADIDALVTHDRVLPAALARSLLSRAVERAAEASIDLAIVSQVRVDVRLLACLWQLANRWGRVSPAGVRIELPLTHSLLACLVAAHRPSVTNAIQRLVTGSHLVRDGRAFVLQGDASRVGVLERALPLDDVASPPAVV